MVWRRALIFICYRLTSTVETAAADGGATRRWRRRGGEEQRLLLRPRLRPELQRRADTRRIQENPPIVALSLDVT